MKARIVLTVELGEPKDWRRRENLKWIPDNRPLEDTLDDRLAAAVMGVEEYAGDVEEAAIEPYQPSPDSEPRGYMNASR